MIHDMEKLERQLASLLVEYTVSEVLLTLAEALDKEECGGYVETDYLRKMGHEAQRREQP